MSISSRTPEGERNRCPVCGQAVVLEPSRPPGDAPCPHCGTLLWFSPDSPARLQTAWEHGVQVLAQGHIDLGLAILQNVVTRQPKQLADRQTLRIIERHVRAPQRGTPHCGAAAVLDVEHEIRQLKSYRSDAFIEWDLVDRAAERGLSVDPWNVAFHLELGHACRARGYDNVARFAYACALEIDPNRDEEREGE